MKKKLLVFVFASLLCVPTLAFASTSDQPNYVKDRPYNGSGHSIPLKDGSSVNFSSESTGITVPPMSPPGTYSKRVYTEPLTVSVAIYDRDSTGAEIWSNWHGNVSVDFETYVKDVLPNEWYESYGGSYGAQEALKAGALAVKTYAWYMHLHPKDFRHGADLTNGTGCQMYTAGSHYSAPNSNAAVDAVATQVLGDQYGDIWESDYGSSWSNDGYHMSQNGSIQDALNGMSYISIINKWYSNQPFSVVNYVQDIPIGE